MFSRSVGAARVGATCVLGAALLLWTSAAAVADAGFYKDKTLTIISPAAPGGSYDLYARLAAAHLPKKIPAAGAIVQNMTGAGGLRAINYLYSVAPKDGTALLVPTQDAALSEALGQQGLAYKTERMHWIGRIAPSLDLSITWHTSKVKSIADAKAHQANMAATGPNSPTTTNLLALNALLGTKFNIIQGYKSNADMSIAMERGETYGAFATWSTLKTSYPHWIENKQLNYLVVYAVERIPELPQVPAVTELTSDEQAKAVLALLASSGTLGRSLVTTPDVPAERVTALRQAFDKMVVDPEFTAEVKRLRIEFGPMSGKDLQAEIARLAQLPPAVVARTRDILAGTAK